MGSAPTRPTSSSRLSPSVNAIVWILASGFFSAAVGVLFGLPSLAHQGLLSRGRDAGGAVLPAMDVHPRPLALQLQRLGRDRGADAHALRHPHHWAPTATPQTRYLRGADARRRAHLARLEPRAWPHRAHVDGRARHGYRGGVDGHPAAAHEAPSLRGIVLLLRRRRRALCCSSGTAARSTTPSTSTSPFSSCSWSSSADSAA